MIEADTLVMKYNNHGAIGQFGEIICYTTQLKRRTPKCIYSTYFELIVYIAI